MKRFTLTVCSLALFLAMTLFSAPTALACGNYNPVGNQGTSHIQLSPTSGPDGTYVTVTGSGFTANQPVELACVGCMAQGYADQHLTNTQADGQGNLYGTIPITGYAEPDGDTFCTRHVIVTANAYDGEALFNVTN